MMQMGMDKAIAGGKEYRRPYRRAKAADRNCRNHGDCPYCKSNRLYAVRKALLKCQSKEKEAGI